MQRILYSNLNHPYNLSAFSLTKFFFSILIFIAPFYWIPYLPVSPFSAFKNGLVFLVFILTGMLLVANRTLKIPKNPVIYIALILPFMLLPGLLKGSGLQNFMRYIDYISPILFFFLALYLLQLGNLKDIKRYRFYIVIPMLIQAIYVVLVLYNTIPLASKPSTFGGTTIPYSLGLSATQTQFSPSLALVIPLILGIAVENFKKRPPLRWKGTLWMVTLVPLVIAITASHGRAGILSAAVGIGVFLFFFTSRIVYSFGIIVFGIIVNLFIHPSRNLLDNLLYSSFREFFKLGPDVSYFTSKRVLYFRYAWDIFKRYPLTGVGFGNLDYTVDNLYLAILAQGGLIAGLATLTLVFTAIYKGHKTVKFLENSSVKILAISLFASLVVFLVDSFFEQAPILLNFYMCIPWWICLGSLLMLPRFVEKYDKK